MSEQRPGADPPKKDCGSCGNQAMDMDMDPYCSAVNEPWGHALYAGKPKECGPESKLYVIDTRRSRIGRM